MKDLLLLWQCVANELAAWCCASTDRDLKKAAARFEHEGLSFFTITLPDYAKDFERCLDAGFVDDTAFAGFARKAGLPLFLGGFLSLVFEPRTGRLLPYPSTDAIFAVRQITRLYSKVELECTERRIRAAFDGYRQTELELRYQDAEVDARRMARFHRLSSLVFGRLLFQSNLLVDTGGVLPKHGPGATADRLRGNSKYRQAEWTTRLEAVLPMVDMLLPSPSYWEELDMIRVLDPGAERPVKVTTVPKTLKTPRIIAEEPTCMQYAQQGIAEILVDGIEGDPLLSQLIGFRRQEPNQFMAKEGSITGDLATLDLSEASDRVSNQHVRLLLRGYDALADAVDACRSRKADVPGHGVIRLAKFASMGSALTFPIEAMVFLTVVLCGIERELDRPMTPSDLHGLKGKVRVYGDDIIVPVRYARAVIEELHAFGHVVNLNKSFWTGKFRESCGKEYYEGHDVSIVKARRVLPRSLQDVQEVISWVSTRNQFYQLGMWETCRWLDSRLEKVLKYKYPIVEPTSSVLGRHSFWPCSANGSCSDRQIPLVKGYVPRERLPKDAVPLGDHFALLKWFLKRGEEPFVDRKHLERSGRPETVNIKLRWAAPF